VSRNCGLPSPFTNGSFSILIFIYLRSPRDLPDVSLYPHALMFTALLRGRRACWFNAIIVFYSSLFHIYLFLFSCENLKPKLSSYLATTTRHCVYYQIKFFGAGNTKKQMTARALPMSFFLVNACTKAPKQLQEKGNKMLQMFLLPAFSAW